jgi:diacylglycerol kinase
MFSIKRLKNSFLDASKGLRYVFLGEQNFRIQVFFAILAIIIMFLFNIKTSEKIIVLMLITLILILELVNTVVEKFINLLKPRMELQAGIIKDIMAGAVFIASFGSVIVGSMIFYPYLVNLFENL